MLTPRGRVARPALPEPGQVFKERGSTWAVVNVQAEGLPRHPADEATARPSSVIDVASLNEDRLGEQPSVVLKLEDGHADAPRHGLSRMIFAEVFDQPTTLTGIVDIMRRGAVMRADPKRYQVPRTLCRIPELGCQKAVALDSGRSFR